METEVPVHTIVLQAKAIDFSALQEKLNTIFGQVEVYPITWTVLLSFFALMGLLVCSALISGSEVAFFSLKDSDAVDLEKNNSLTSEYINYLRARPEKLLATILISNNTVNVAIIILSTFITDSLFDFTLSPVLGFVFQVVAVTFLLLLFGEIIPKVYAANFGIRFASFMAYPLLLLEKIFRPFSRFLIRSTAVVDSQLSSKAASNFSMDELHTALDVTRHIEDEDRERLSGILRYVNIEAHEIMKPRVDVVAIDLDNHFDEVLKTIRHSSYSRIPVYRDSFDNVEGVLYIKDLLRYIDKPGDFKWQQLLKQPYFVPENKKVNDLMVEFQQKKIHMAIVVDEYGGTMGIVTLEDILEEITGDISDEIDIDEEIDYTQLDEHTYVFSGKTLLNDFCKILQLPDDYFNQEKGEAETLAGLLLEYKGGFPRRNELLAISNYRFQVIESDKRRIIKIKVVTP